MKLRRRRGLGRRARDRPAGGRPETEGEGGGRAPGLEGLFGPGGWFAGPRGWFAGAHGWFAGRRDRWLRTALVVLLCFGAGYLIAATWLFPTADAAAPAEVVRVPDVLGEEVAEAERRAAERGLGVAVAARLPHPRAPAGEVVAQSPLGGRLAVAGDTLRLAVSTGRSAERVPSLRGLPEARAVALLERLGFTVRVDTAASGRPGVQETEPPAGTRVELPAEVTLRVGEAVRIVEVPELRGRHIEDVEAVLAERGLQLGAVRYDPDAPQAPGRVVGQSPPPGYASRSGGLVSVQVAGPPGRE